MESNNRTIDLISEDNINSETVNKENGSNIVTFRLGDENHPVDPEDEVILSI